MNSTPDDPRLDLLMQEFMDRRLSPAMATCASVAGRQSELSARIARASSSAPTFFSK